MTEFDLFPNSTMNCRLSDRLKCVSQHTLQNAMGEYGHYIRPNRTTTILGIFVQFTNRIIGTQRLVYLGWDTARMFDGTTIECL